MRNKKNKFRMVDWAGNELTAHGVFDSWDDAEEKLSEFLDEDYETDRGEYYIVEFTAP